MRFRKRLPTGQYMQTPQGMAGRHRWRQCQRVLFSLDARLKSKKAMRLHEQLAFQRTILAQLIEQKRNAFRGRIIADFLLGTEAPTPPQIHTVMKILLDLFGAPLPGLNANRRGLVYKDDRLIKALSVRYHVGHSFGTREGWIAAQFGRYSDFLRDLEAAQSLVSGYQGRERNELAKLWDLDDEDDNGFRDSLRWFKDLENRARTGSQEQERQQLLEFLRGSIQESFLKTASLRLSTLAALLGGEQCSSSNSGHILRKGFAQQIEQLLKMSGIRIRMDAVPTSKGEGAAFKQAVERKFHDFIKQSRIPWRPLRTPVTLEVLYKPPRTAFDFHKDLDNLMRLILPSFHAIFQPPINPLLTLNRELLSPDMIKHFDALHLQIPASVRYSVVGYDIFELTRDPADESPGYISVGLASGTEGGRLWSRLDDFFDKARELDDA